MRDLELEGMKQGKYLQGKVKEVKMLESLKLLPKVGAIVKLMKEVGIFKVGTIGRVKKIYPEKQILIQIRDEFTLVKKEDIQYG